MDGRFYDHEKIAKLRKGRHMSLIELARELNVSAMTIYRVENGRNCSEELLWKIAQFFGMGWFSLLRRSPLQAENGEFSAAHNISC